jgi:hypothetical protein
MAGLCKQQCGTFYESVMVMPRLYLASPDSTSPHLGFPGAFTGLRRATTLPGKRT